MVLTIVIFEIYFKKSNNKFRLNLDGKPIALTFALPNKTGTVLKIKSQIFARVLKKFFKLFCKLVLANKI